MLKAFVQSTDKNLQELKNATMANIRDIQELKSSVARIEGQIGHLVTELNRIEEEELQSQLMIERHYMIDEDDSENSYHEHAQVTTTLESEEIVDNNEEQVEQIERVEPHEKSSCLHHCPFGDTSRAQSFISCMSPRAILCQDTQGSLHTSAKI
jgi:hypothetical protein